MAAEVQFLRLGASFLKFGRQFKLRNCLAVFSHSINPVLGWVYRYVGERNHLLPNGNYEGTKLSWMENEMDGKPNILSHVFWMAAPKKRTSRKTKWLRHQRKFIKNREDVEICSVCGNAKLINHLCGTCFERNQKAAEEVLKDFQNQPRFWQPSLPENLKHFYKK